MTYYFYIPLLFISLLGGGMLKDYIEVKYCRIEIKKGDDEDFKKKE